MELLIPVQVSISKEELSEFLGTPIDRITNVEWGDHEHDSILVSFKVRQRTISVVPQLPAPPHEDLSVTTKPHPGGDAAPAS